MTPRILRFLASSLLAVAFAASAATDTPASPIDELMVKSGLWVQVAQFPGQFEQGMEQGAEQERARNKPTFDDAALARLKLASKKAFDVDRLRKDTRDALAALLKPEDIGATLAWLNSPLGTRITRLEEVHGASADLAASLRLQEVVKAHAATLAPDRVRRLKSLVTATRAGEFGADLMINVTMATMIGMASVMPLSDTSSLRDLPKRMQAQRDAFVRALDVEAVAQFGYIYRTLPDSELDQYVAFSRSPAGLNYNAAAVDALKSVLVNATYVFATDLGLEALREKPSPS